MNTSAISTAVATATNASKNGLGVLGRTNLHRLDPTRVFVKPGHNPRVDFGDLEALAASIEESGLINPIRVKRGFDANDVPCFYIVDGGRRFAAIQILLNKGFVFPEGIKAIIVPNDQSEVTDLIEMFLANEGLPFSALEEAAAYEKFLNAGLTYADIAKKVGRSYTHILQISDLAKADDSLKAALQAGTIGKTTARQIVAATKGDLVKQKELVEEAVGLSSGAKDRDARQSLALKIEGVVAEKAVRAGRAPKATKVQTVKNVISVDLMAEVTKRLDAAMKERNVTSEVEFTAQNPHDNFVFLQGMMKALKILNGETSTMMF